MEIHKTRDDPIFGYVFKRWVQGKDGELVPEGVKLKVRKAFRGGLCLEKCGTWAIFRVWKDEKAKL